LKRVMVLAVFSLTAASVSFAEVSSTPEMSLEVRKNFPKGRIEFRNLRGLSEAELQETQKIRLVRDNRKGHLTFRGELKDRTVTFYTQFSVYRTTPVARVRVSPQQPLQGEQFNLQEVEVTTGMARQMKDLMFESIENLRGKESTQTILPGHYPLQSGVRKIPDIRRGEVVNLRMISGGLILSVPATASQDGHVSDVIKVMTQRTKKVLSGKITPQKMVEVTL